MSASTEIKIDAQRLADLCKRYHVNRLWLFGSIVRPDFRPDSDVDVLLETKQPIGMFKLGGLQADLSELLNREVHLTMLRGVPKDEQPRLLRSATLQYAA